MISIVRYLASTAVLVTVTTSVIRAQTPHHHWELGTRLLATGTSRTSEPSGYTLYSAFPLEVFARRSVAERLDVELAVRMEAREVDQTGTPAVPLGSIDFLPFNLLLHYRLGHGRWSPYLGAGVNLTAAWEKTGALDSMDVSPSVGPAVGIGLNVAMNEHLALNIDFRWNMASHDVTYDGVRQMQLMVDPSALGVGFGVKF